MTANQPGVWTRRRFLKTLGATSGGAAVMNAMSAWGMLPAAALAQTEPPQLEGRAEGTSVIVIGTGPGGSAAAYELIKLGYDVTILEANDRVGGHVFTVRGGSKTTEYGKGEQVCDWDEGVWYDAGPSRIPFYHRAFFHYSKELGIPLIDYNNINLNAWVYAEDIDGSLDGTKMRLHEMRADMAGYTSTLLAKAVDSGTLDDELTQVDMEQLVEYLVTWGSSAPPTSTTSRRIIAATPRFRTRRARARSARPSRWPTWLRSPTRSSAPMPATSPRRRCSTGSRRW